MRTNIAILYYILSLKGRQMYTGDIFHAGRLDFFLRFPVTIIGDEKNIYIDLFLQNRLLVTSKKI